MILVSQSYEGGVAAVYRDADGAWLGVRPTTDDGETASFGGTLLDTRPSRIGIGGGRLVFGGLLPAGASRAIVEGTRAVTGDGAWIAVVASLDAGDYPAARFEADDGTIIRPVLPANWMREPVSDADEHCPACGAVTWERVTPADGSRGHSSSGATMRPSAVIACLRCGYEVAEGGWYGPGDSARDAFRALRRPLRAVRDRWGLRSTRPSRPASGKLDFPVFALARAGADAEQIGHGWDPKGVHSVTLHHDGVQITTRALSRAFVEADSEIEHALSSVIHNAEPLNWGSGSNPARALRIHAHRRAVTARVARAQPFTVALSVDGTPVHFTGRRDPAGWAVVADTDRVRIVIAAGRIEPEAIALRQL